ncbi:MAG: hypothetical protein ACR2PO_19550 [Methyloligellaceae bacterium]
MAIEPSGDETTAATGTSDDKPQDPTANGSLAKDELIAGGIHARLKPIEPGTAYPADSAVFAEITLTNKSGATRVGAELVLEPEIAEIHAVVGTSVKARDVGLQRVAAVPLLRRNKPRKVVVELRLRDGGQVPGGNGRKRNLLKVTLRPTGSRSAEGSDSTTLSWPVLDCAGAFHTDIAKLRDSRVERMMPVLKAGRTQDRARPGRWLFRPPITVARTRRVCRRWQRVWDQWQWRWRSRCTRWVRVNKTAKRGAGLSKSDAKIFRFARGFVVARGSDPELSTKRHYGWVSHRVATDLGGYLKQERHPAICTGAIELVGYFDQRMGDVRTRADKIAGYARDARKLAVDKLEAARETKRSDPGGHPGWGAMPLGLSHQNTASPLKNFVVEIAMLVGQEQLLERVKAADDAFAALRAVKELWKTAAKSLPATIRSKLETALAAIEAADYLDMVDGHYRNIAETIGGSLTAIRSAHTKHCRCDG